MYRKRKKIDQNGQKDDDEFMTTGEAAAYLKYKPATFRKWRMEKKGPRYLVNEEGGIRYRKCWLNEWAESHVVNPKKNVS